MDMTTTKTSGGATIRVTRKQIEKRLDARLRRGWILDGAGPARYGWASLHPCRERWEGRTLSAIAARLDDRSCDAPDPSGARMEVTTMTTTTTKQMDEDEVQS